MRPYNALIHRGGVPFPDLPGCLTAAATLEEACAQAEAALAFHLDGVREVGVKLALRPTIEFGIAERGVKYL